MKVPFFVPRTLRDLSHRAEIEAAASRAIASGRYIGGEEVEAFEHEIADFLQVEHAIGVSSGTDALLASLMAIGVGPGDEVIVPAFTFVATATAVARLGATVVFADVRDDDLTIDWERVRRVVTDRTRAIVPVNLFGVVPSALDRYPNVYTIADSAQAFGSYIKTLGDLDCHSFFPTKNLAACGDAGMVTTSDARLAEIIRMIRNHGVGSDKYHHEILGGNFRLDAIQAAILRVKLRSAPYEFDVRKRTASRYHQMLEEVAVAEIALPPRLFYGVPNQFVIRVLDGKRDTLRDFMTSRGIETEVYYPTPLHRQPCVTGWGDGFPVAERAAREVLALPIFPGITEVEISYVCEAILDFF